MHIELQINDEKADFFLEYLNSFKNGVIENITIKKNTKQSFLVGSIEEVRERVDNAKKRGNYTSHQEFWEEMGVE